MAFSSFEEIEAWQEARRLSRLIKKFRKRALLQKDWSWVDQITRSVISVMANIAEGNDCQTDAEFVVFLGYSKRSAAETRSHLYYGLDEGYVLPDEFEETAEMTKKIGAQLANLIRYLRNNKRKVRFVPQSSDEPTSDERQRVSDGGIIPSQS